MPSTTTTLQETIHTEVIAGAAIGYDARPGVDQFVTQRDLTGETSETAQFPIVDNQSAAAVAEGTDFSTVSDLDTSGSATASTSEHAIMGEITNRVIMASTEDWAGAPRADVVTAASVQGRTMGRIHLRALRNLKDQDICALFSAFNSSTGSNSGPLTSTLLSDATTLLAENNAVDELGDNVVCVAHATQLKSLVPVFDDASTFGQTGLAIVRGGVSGFGMLYGAVIFRSNNVRTATVSASTVYAGAVMTPEAVGVAIKGPMPIVGVDYDASARQAQIISVGMWGEVEYRGGATTSGRGGAGVYFYSNTTN